VSPPLPHPLSVRPMKSDITEAGHRIEVRKIASDEHVQSYLKDGYLVVPDLISMKEIDELRQDALFIARGGYPCESLNSAPEVLSDDEVLQNILCIHQPHYVSRVMQKYVRHPKICGVLSKITGAHLPDWDGSVKCMQSMLFVKPANFQGQAWHQDEIYIPTRDRSLIGAWIAMDDATVENGCLWVLPSSHRRGYLYPQHLHDNPEEFDYGEESYGFDTAREIPVEVKVGTLVFFNGYLLHRSRKNIWNTYRRVLVNHYCNAWSLLPWRLKEGERPAHADDRRIIPVAGVDPYAWKGYDQSTQNVSLRMCKAIEEKRAIEVEG